MAETTLDPMANVAQLRQQLRTRLQGNLTQGQDLLNAYQEAYPQLDVRSIQGAMTPQPMYGVNLHGRPTDLSPAWIQEQTIEPVAFGSLADPVSQLAFLAAPGALRVGKQALETMGSPGPGRFSLLAGERGNLGLVPRNQQGVPLPESQVRGPQGELKRLYHGTSKTYADFDPAYYGSGEGGDLYGPGIYMTENPRVASGYARPAARSSPPDVERALAAKQADLADMQARLVRAQDQQHRFGGGAADRGILAEWEDRVQGLQEDIRQLQALTEQGPQVRPVYADLKKPFDIEAPADASIVKKLDELGWDYHVTQTGAPDIPTNKELYNVLLRNLGDKSEVNDWLAANGFDGITHMGGAVTGGTPHRVFISFSPDTVYPASNVEAIMQAPLE